MASAVPSRTFKPGFLWDHYELIQQAAESAGPGQEKAYLSG
jgi:hypothetical protein